MYITWVMVNTFKLTYLAVNLLISVLSQHNERPSFAHLLIFTFAHYPASHSLNLPAFALLTSTGSSGLGNKCKQNRPLK